MVFFILTGYKFRPGCNNPYFKLENSDHAEVLTKTGLTEKVQKRKNQEKNGEKQVSLYIPRGRPRSGLHVGPLRGP